MTTASVPTPPTALIVIPALQQRAGPDAVDEPAADLAGQRDAGGVGGEHDAVELWREAVDVLQDERGAPEVDAQRGERQRRARHQADERAIAREHREGAARRGQPAAVAALRRQGLGQQQRAGDEQDDADRRHRHETAAPVGHVQQLPPASGASTGASAPTVSSAANRRALAAPSVMSRTIAPESTMPVAPASALDQAEHEQHPHRRRGGAQQRHHREDRHPGQQRAQAAELVADRADEDLAGAQADHARGHRQLGGRRGRRRGRGPSRAARAGRSPSTAGRTSTARRAGR